MILLLGTHHYYQYYAKDNYGLVKPPSRTNNNQCPRTFEKVLRSIMKKKKFPVIIEEYNFEAKRENGATKVIAKDIASRFRVEHFWCDPSRIEREQLGIPIDYAAYCMQAFFNNTESETSKEEYYSFRENIWLERMQPYLEKYDDLLFICGADHLPTFSQLLQSQGYKVLTHKYVRYSDLHN